MSDHLKPIVEALIFASPDPVTPKTLYKLLESEPREDIDAAVAAVRADYDRPGGLQLVEVAGGYQIVTVRNCTNGSASCFTSGRRRSCRSNRSRRWQSSRTSSPSPLPRLPRFAASAAAEACCPR